MAKKLTKAQKEMRERVYSLEKYVETYSGQPGYLDYSVITFTNDMLYGIGLALDPKRYRNADGYQEFLRVLKIFIANETRYRKKHVLPVREV